MPNIMVGSILEDGVMAVSILGPLEGAWAAFGVASLVVSLGVSLTVQNLLWSSCGPIAKDTVVGTDRPIWAMTAIGTHARKTTGTPYRL